jgi:hypothetical protein
VRTHRHYHRQGADLGSIKIAFGLAGDGGKSVLLTYYCERDRANSEVKRHKTLSSYSRQSEIGRRTATNELNRISVMGTKEAWTPERRARQAELIRQTKPWLKSTGPKTKDGKGVSARNAYAGDWAHELWARQDAVMATGLALAGRAKKQRYPTTK